MRLFYAIPVALLISSAVLTTHVQAQNLELKNLKVKDNAYDNLFQRYEVMLNIIDGKNVPHRSTHGRDLRDQGRGLLAPAVSKTPLVCALMYFDDVSSLKALFSYSGSNLSIQGMIGDTVGTPHERVYIEFHLELTSGISSLRCEMTDAEWEKVTYGDIEKAMNSTVAFIASARN
jgi:hypothetical protein